MVGNVWEWVNDWYLSNYYNAYPVDGWPQNPPGSDTGTYKVLRGGAFLNDRRSVRCAARDWLYPGDGDYYFGFRVVVSPFFQ